MLVLGFPFLAVGVFVSLYVRRLPLIFSRSLHRLVSCSVMLVFHFAHQFPLVLIQVCIVCIHLASYKFAFVLEFHLTGGSFRRSSFLGSSSVLMLIRDVFRPFSHSPISPLRLRSGKFLLRLR